MRFIIIIRRRHVVVLPPHSAAAVAAFSAAELGEAHARDPVARDTDLVVVASHEARLALHRDVEKEEHVH